MIPLENMSTSSILIALKQASYLLGTLPPKIIFCDSQGSFLTLKKLETDQSDQNDIKDMKKLFLQNGIILMNNIAHSAWRNSMSEIINKIYKMALQKSGLAKKTFSLFYWNYILAKIEFVINSRYLTLRYVSENFEGVTPNELIFGSKDPLLPSDLTQSFPDGNLFEAVKMIDSQLEKFQNIYAESYALEIKKWLKWKSPGTKIAKGAIVMV